MPDDEEIVRHMYALANEGRWAEFLQHFHEDGVLDEALFITRTRYVGHDGVREWMAFVGSVITDPSYDVESVEPVGDGLLVRYWLEAKGATSTAPISQRVFHAVRV